MNITTLDGYATDMLQRLSTYEVKLRDVLKLRKKLKPRDWKRIHLFAQSQEYGKPYDVYLNGILIPWPKAWKEIRRTGAAKLVSHCK